jgi:hypothetical protein
MKKIKNKLEALISSVLPYLRQQVSAAMGQPIEVVIICLDSKGDAQAFSGLPDEFLFATLHGLLEQKKMELTLKTVH